MDVRSRGQSTPATDYYLIMGWDNSKFSTRSHGLTVRLWFSFCASRTTLALRFESCRIKKPGDRSSSLLAAATKYSPGGMLRNSNLPSESLRVSKYPSKLAELSFSAGTR